MNSIVVLVIAGFLPALAALSCPGLNETLAKMKNAYIYPPNCTLEKVPLKAKCFWVCNKGYGFKDGSNTETECNFQRYDKTAAWRNYQFYQNECSPSTKCPPLDSYNNKTWNYISCQKYESSVGETCKAAYCSRPKLLGPQEKLCQSNGTWTPVGIPYCKPDSIPTSIHCVPGFTVRTDTGKATADVTGKLPSATSDIAESDIVVTYSKNIHDLKALPVGNNRITYTIQTRGRQYAKYCYVDVRVVDKEPPMIVGCPKQLLYTAPAGLKVKLEVNDSAIQFLDGVKGPTRYYTLGNKGDASPNQLKSPGNYTMMLGSFDGSNDIFCEVQVIVKARPCKMRFPPPNGYPIVASNGNTFVSECRNGSRNVCDAMYQSFHLFDVFRCKISHDIVGVGCGVHWMKKPLTGCINESLIVDAVNKTCPDGKVIDNSQTKCFPCPRSMYYNATTKTCYLCPENTTNYEFGSDTCYPCPAHQMTKLAKAPRFCEDICSPGSWIGADNRTCTKCTRGYYASSGARACMKCPEGLTTLEEESTSLEDCVYGGVAFGDSGTTEIDPTNATLNNTSYQLNIKPTSDIRDYSFMAFKFQSSYLNQTTNCSEDFVRVVAVLDSIRFELTGRICGSQTTEPVVVSLPKQGLIVEYSVQNTSSPMLSVTYGVANCKIGEYFDFNKTRCEKCPLNTYQLKIGSTKCDPCTDGKVTRETGAAGCVDKCPVGTIKNGTSCSECPVGYYQDEAIESTSCKRCPNNTVTRRRRSVSINDCISPCAAGQYKTSDGCKQCQVGMYQDTPHHAYGLCKFCPKGTTTIELGSKSNTSCVVECNYEGEYYDSDNATCKKCPVGTYKLASDRQVTQCTKCPTNHTTNRLGAASVTECIDIYDHCSLNPCKFPGWCEDKGTDYKCHCPYLYEGRHCEIKKHACESQPCQNNGTCHNLYLGKRYYVCDCPPGYTGVNCESVYYPCKALGNPCGVGNCTNVGNSFKCQCPPWITGDRCHGSLSKPCMRYPCRYGTCIDGPYPNSSPPYTCVCNADFTGKDCDKRIDDCIHNNCNKTGTLACVDQTNSYRCNCKLGFKGSTCNVTYGCLPGETYNNRDKTCTKCGIGKYQPYRGDHWCRDCPEGKTTLEIRSKNLRECVDMKKVGKYEVSMRITSEKWTEDLLDTSSANYKSFYQRLKEACKKTYARESKYLTVKIESIRKGSVICKFTLYFESDVKDAGEILKADVQNGSFGEFKVDKDSLETVKSTPGPEKKKNYTLMAVLIVVGVLLVIGVVTLYLLYTRHKSRVRVRFDKMLTNETATIEYPMEDKSVSSE